MAKMTKSMQIEALKERVATLEQRVVAGTGIEGVLIVAIKKVVSLIDTPGDVYEGTKKSAVRVLKGAIRAEMLHQKSMAEIFGEND